MIAVAHRPRAGGRSAHRGRRDPRRAGRAGVGPCPGCGDQIVWSRYIKAPHRRQPGEPAPLLAFDFPPADRDDSYANHAASLGLLTCRLITADDPLEDTESRLVPHLASHPQCTTYLTRNSA